MVKKTSLYSAVQVCTAHLPGMLRVRQGDESFMNYNEEDQEVLRRELPQLAALLRQELSSLRSAIQEAAPAELRDADPEMDRRACAAERSFFRLLRLAGNLNDAELLMDEEQALPMQNVELVELVEDLCRQARGPAELLGVRLRFVCRERAHRSAASTQLLQRLLWHLLANALAATPPGGQICVTMERRRGFVLLRVSDDGCGLPPQTRPIDRWVPGQPDASGHLGLGLPLCARIARGHGGNLLLSSVPGQGTTVTVRLTDRRLAARDVQELHYDYTGGFNAALLELSEVLPESAFAAVYLD